VAAVSAVDNNTNIITTNNNDDNNVLSINSSNDEILTAANDGSFADLNTKINGGSSTNIVLDKDYTYSSTDTIKDGIAISKNNIVIDGNGHKIDANGKSRIFNITGTTVTLKNIVFANGNHNNGGAIRDYGDNLRIINCTFMDNTAKNYGGAVYSYPDSYTVFVNSTFTNNKANTGGAIYSLNYVGYSGDIDYVSYGASMTFSIVPLIQTLQRLMVGHWQY
jgi:predicted outer membrane repeat protein